MGAAKAYLFRVLSHSATSYSFSEELKYDLPENVKRRAVTAGMVGGFLFFIVAIVLSVCTVKICNKRRRRKHDRGKKNRQIEGDKIQKKVIVRVMMSTLSDKLHLITSSFLGKEQSEILKDLLHSFDC